MNNLPESDFAGKKGGLPKKSRKLRKNYKTTVIPPGVPMGAGSKRTKQLAREGWTPYWRAN
jgi:hypothetical protein